MTGNDERRAHAGERRSDVDASDGTTIATVAPAPVIRLPVQRRSTYGLTRRELRAEIERCRRSGWQRWEIRCRFELAS